LRERRSRRALGRLSYRPCSLTHGTSSLQRMPDLPGARALASATSLNPSAGDHVVTADPRELAACERAGKRSWSTWTYYARRYGERGRQFTRSDSAWIATLGGNAASIVEPQIRWLGALLAARGMPRLLLEDHLRILHEELVAAVPERASAYAVLLQAADSLRGERDAAMPKGTLGALETGFHDLVEGAAEDDLRAGALIGAAVADEQAGVPRAVDSLIEWLAEPARFPAGWVAAVEQTLRHARQSGVDAGGSDDPGARGQRRRRAARGQSTR
jgi:hypothetical protein